MLSPLETFASMHEFVGEWKPWLQLMKPEMLMPLYKYEGQLNFATDA